MKANEVFDPYSQSSVKRTLSERGLWLSPKRGQNYLTDRNVAAKIAALVPEGLPVLEVGAGLGALTVPLSQKGPVTAVEIDAGVCSAFAECYSHPGLTLVHADFLRFDLASLPAPRYAFVSNLPYSVSGEILRIFIDSPKFDTAVVMVQKEFLDRIAAGPGGKNYGALAVTAQTFLESRKEFEVSRKCFFPEPSVDSTVVTLVKRETDLPQAEFRAFVAECFRSKRKTLANNLKSAGYVLGVLAGIGIDPASRPEELSPETWRELFAAYKAER